MTDLSPTDPEPFIQKYGESRRTMITRALEFFDKNRPAWNSMGYDETPEDYFEDLVSRFNPASELNGGQAPQ